MQNSNVDWITTKELAEIKGISERAVRKSIAKNKYVIRKSSKSYEILVTSLEESVRKKVTERREKSTALVPINYVVPEEQKKLALAKYDLIKKWDEFRNKKNNKTLAGKDFLDGYNNNCFGEELFNVIGKVAIGTIYEWHKKLREYNDDWHCLINNYTFGEKTTKTSLTEAEQSELLKNLLHPNQLNIGKAIKYTKMALTQRGFENLCCDLTYRRFANNYKAEHYDIWVEAREGNKALHDKVLPYITRDVSKLEVGDVIVGDGHRLAFFVKNPYTGNPVRPTLVAYQDWKSGGFVGFEIMLEENTQCIASALRNSIINLGKVPKFVYQDNGKAFKAKYFIENGISGLFTNLGIQPIYAKPYNAKAKPIERLFRELQDSFEVMLPSYSGTSIIKKPAQLRRNEKLHKSIFKVNIPTIEQVVQVLEIWLQKYHYEQPCPHVEGQTIGEVLNSGRGEGVNIETLDDLMMVREIKNIYRNGILFLRNNYYNEALFGYKKKVIIKYSLFNLSSIKVFKLNGEFICEAKRIEPIHPLANYLGDAKDIEDLKQKTKLKKQLEKRTEKEFINHLKRNQVHTPLLSMDLPEKQENEEVEQLRIEIKEEAEKEFFNGCFRTRFEKYEHLINKENLTQTEQDWIKEYETTDEYEQIYGEDKEISDAQIVC